MNLKLKQRIVGVIIVLTFIAIAIPFLLFSGSKAQNKQETNSNISANTKTANPEALNQQEANSLTPETPITTPASPSDSQESTQNAATTVKTIDIPHLQNNIPKFAVPVSSNNSNEQQNQETNQARNQETETAPYNQNMQITPVPTAPAERPHNTKRPLTTAKKNHTLHKNLSLLTSLPHKKNHKITNNIKQTKTSQLHKTHNKLSDKENVKETKKYAQNIKYNSHTNSISKKQTTKKVLNKKNASQQNLNIHAKQQWLVHTGTYHNKARAQYLLKKLKTSHYQAFIQKNKIKNKIMNRVVVGPIPNQKNAEKLAKKIAKNFHIKTKTIIYTQRKYVFKALRKKQETLTANVKVAE